MARERQAEVIDVINVIDPESARRFLSLRRVALVGASGDERSFAATVHAALVDHGIDVVPVNPTRAEVDGRACYPSLGLVPGGVEGVLVMTPPGRSSAVVRDCLALGIRHVWLFRGVGTGSVSEEAVALCREHDLDAVVGACPLMFLEPVGWVHRVHRSVKHLNGSLRREVAA
jgi:predicted CoA-binding protein